MEEKYEIKKHTLYGVGDGYPSFSSKEGAEEEVKGLKEKEQRKRSEYKHCPHCDKKLDITKDLEKDYKELLLRVENLKSYSHDVLDKKIGYKYTLKYYNEKVELTQMREILKNISSRIYNLAQGKLRVTYNSWSDGFNYSLSQSGLNFDAKKRHLIKEMYEKEEKGDK